MRHAQPLTAQAAHAVRSSLPLKGGGRGWGSRKQKTALPSASHSLRRLLRRRRGVLRRLGREWEIKLALRRDLPLATLDKALLAALKKAGGSLAL